LIKLADQPKRVKSYFEAKPIQYASEKTGELTRRLIKQY
ncbi:MAG: hypothetical protein ACI9SQ_002090, partial [Rubritalea sp.]